MIVGREKNGEDAFLVDVDGDGAGDLLIGADQAILGGSGVPLRELVGGLNALGVSPRDLIVIMQALKASGALQADIEVM